MHPSASSRSFATWLLLLVPVLKAEATPSQEAEATTNSSRRASESEETGWGVSCNRLVYNRVPKTGSTTLSLLIEELSKKNGFREKKDKVYFQDHLTPDTGREAYARMRSTMGWRSNRCPPSQGSGAHKKSVYINHVFFLDYDLLSQQDSRKKRESLATMKKCRPLFMNMVRDPISKCVSNYYYHFQSKPHPGETSLQKARVEARLDINDCVAVVLGGEPPRSGLDPSLYDGCLDHCQRKRLYSYFCGYHPECEAGDEASYLRAKANVENSYLTVGITEMMKESVAVWERLLPSYFAEASETLATLPREKVTLEPGTFYTMPSYQTVRHLASFLKEDYAFYEWLVFRLKKQHTELATLKPHHCET